jgi:hypothetical protein
MTLNILTSKLFICIKLTDTHMLIIITLTTNKKMDKCIKKNHHIDSQGDVQNMQEEPEQQEAVE